MQPDKEPKDAPSCRGGRFPWSSLTLSLLLSTAGCAQQVETTFTPYSVMAPRVPAVTASAIVVYAGDADMLWRTGGVMLGSLYVEGDPSYVDLVEKAQQKAAENGGTHVILRVTHKIPSTYPNSNSWTSPAVIPSGPSSDTAYLGYDVIHVPPERWGQLPPVMRPRALPAGNR